jgi:APA family basic amino acid/polyamine antiporter
VSYATTAAELYDRPTPGETSCGASALLCRRQYLPMTPNPATRGGNELALPRVLGGWSLMLLGVGAIIGTGIWVLTGTAAANHAGPAVVLSFVIAAAAAALAGLCYAELASMFPIAGGAYSYSTAALGEVTGWFVGWALVLEYLFGAATVATGWSAYIGSFLQSAGLPLPHEISTAALTESHPGSVLSWSGSFVNLPAVLIVVAISTVCYLGIRVSVVFNAVIVTIKLFAIVLVIGFGTGYIEVANWTPFVPPNSGRFGEFGWSGVLRGAAIVFFAYVGFDAISTAAQETKDPQRDMPFALLGSLVLCATLYVLVAAVVTGIAHYTLLDTPAPVATALDLHASLAWLAAFTKLGALAGMTSALLMMVLAQSRVVFAMATDGLLPRALCRLHPRFQTPALATVLVGAAAAAIAGLLPIQVLSQMISMGTLLAFAVVCGSVLLLRFTRRQLHRPFRVPFASLMCPAGVLVCIGMILALPPQTWVRVGAWILVGAGIYLFIRRRNRSLPRCNSELANQPPTVGRH